MKLKLFYLICLGTFIFSYSSLSGQNYSIVEPGKQWNSLFASDHSYEYTTVKMTLSEELTEFNGKQYREVLRYNFKTGEYLDYFDTFLREEGNIVYEYVPKVDREFELFNFDMEIGDTTHRYLPGIFLFDLIVIDIDSVTLNGNSVRKRIVLECSGENTFASDPVIYWIEGMGDYYGTLSNVYYCDSEPLEYLLCFYEDGEMLWQNDYYDSCLMTSTEKITDLGISVYPNPFSDKITIEGASDKIDYKIYSLLGMEMMNGQLSGNTINVESLDSGVYFLLLTIDGKIQSIKIVK